MKISMAGIDYKQAGVREREAFSFTQSAAEKAVRKLKEDYGVQGCVLLSTCNRTELWIAGEGAPPPAVLLSALKGRTYGREGDFFVSREGGDAVAHLYEVACGLDSRIFGEDQIITQVNGALALARGQNAAGPVLETLFRSAVTAAKRVKTEMHLTGAHPSSAESAVRLLKERFETLEGLDCLVIGNGEMGRLAASALVREGCRVTMTLRQYRRGEAVIPGGCRVIPYEERLAYLPQVQVVVSATLSPHYTLKREAVEPVPGARVYLDLAVPRDIDPTIAGLPGATLFDIDALGSSALLEQEKAQAAAARRIIAEYRAEFESWYSFRGCVPLIQEISRKTAEDLKVRTQKTIHKEARTPQAAGEIETRVAAAGEKAVSRLLYGLRENLDPRAWESCLTALQAAAAGEEEPVGAGCAHAQTKREEKTAVRNEKKAELPLKFPLYMELDGKRAVVLGGGKIAARRVETLRLFGARVTVISPVLSPRLEALWEEGKLTWMEREYRPGDCDGAALATACTDSREANRQAALECRKARIPVSVADRKEEGSFYFPAVVTDGEIVVGVASNGGSHGRTRAVADAIRALRGRIFAEGEAHTHE